MEAAIIAETDPLEFPLLAEVLRALTAVMPESGSRGLQFPGSKTARMIENSISIGKRILCPSGL
jgi:hypothetical protein